ncbi:PHD finger protein ALFIN 1 [Spatholobus suberectus]|nr:PHD finger protein ALFIN 1 [Spatholobus suberectus]
MVFIFKPRTVEEISKDYSGRRTAVIRSLTDVYGVFFQDMDNLCLYGHPNEAWEVIQEVPPELPEPVLGINSARHGMNCRDWLSMVAGHSDSWLRSMAFYLGARLNRNGRKPINDKPTVDKGSKSWGSAKRSNAGQVKSNSKFADEGYEEDKDEHNETFCGFCGGNYNADEFWIGCNICEKWFHGECVKITPAKAENIKQYKCPSCNLRRSMP